MTEATQDPGTALSARSQDLATQANALTVTDDESYGAAVAFQKNCKALENEMLAFMKPLIDTAHKAHKAATTRRKELVGPVQEAGKTAGRMMGVYHAQCEQERQAAEAILQEQEQRRIDAEALQYAEGLERHGNDEAATDVLDHIPVAEVKAESMAPKVAGTSVRTTWSFEIEDASAVPRDYLMPDEKAIGAMVRARKGETKIAGVRVFSDVAVHSRKGS